MGTGVSEDGEGFSVLGWGQGQCVTRSVLGWGQGQCVTCSVLEWGQGQCVTGWGSGWGDTGKENKTNHFD